MPDPYLEPDSTEDIGCRELPEEPVTPDTTLRELVSARYENSCFDTIYAGLALLQRGEPIEIRGVPVTLVPLHLMEALRFGGDVDPGMFAPSWLQRVRELLDEIAKENGYEPPSHPGADASRPDPSHED